MSDAIPVPQEGRLTFDAEGQEGGRFHSRHFHVPTASSGLTIGRGYDMKMRTKSNIRDDFIEAGLDTVTATLISQAAGKKGEQAEEFIEENELEDFEITPAAQLKLFMIEYERQTQDTRRLATKRDVTRKYGPTHWDALHPAIKEVLVDLRFRGDYTPSSRKFLQAQVAKNDLLAFAKEIGDADRWPNVPADRLDRRQKICKAALAIA